MCGFDLIAIEYNGCICQNDLVNSVMVDASFSGTNLYKVEYLDSSVQLVRLIWLS